MKRPIINYHFSVMVCGKKYLNVEKVKELESYINFLKEKLHESSKKIDKITEELGEYLELKEPKGKE